MPRQPRIQFAGAFYHIFSRGVRRARIFYTDEDYLRFEQFLIEAVNACRIRIYNWCLMPNHFHLLIQTPDGNLAEFMSRLLTRYALYFNWRHRSVGHVFQGRYGSRVCEKEAYFRALIRYIQLNPYKAKRGPLAAFGQWPWSSHKYFMGQPAPGGISRWLDEALALFGDTPASARLAYLQYLSDGLAGSDWESFYQPKENCFLGSDAFVQAVKRQSGERREPVEARWKRVNSVEELVACLAPLSPWSVAELRSASQIRSLSRWRQALIYAARRYGGLPRRSIAEFFRRDDTSVNHAIGWIETRPEKTAELMACERGLRQEDIQDS